MQATRGAWLAPAGALALAAALAPPPYAPAQGVLHAALAALLLACALGPDAWRRAPLSLGWGTALLAVAGLALFSPTFFGLAREVPVRFTLAETLLYAAAGAWLARRAARA